MLWGQEALRLLLGQEALRLVCGEFSGLGALLPRVWLPRCQACCVLCCLLLCCMLRCLCLGHSLGNASQLCL